MQILKSYYFLFLKHPSNYALEIQHDQIYNLNMSLVQEFVEQQLSKTLSSTITQQLQICHSAVEDLLLNLESLRSGPKLETIRSKINRISIFLEAKQQILRLIQAQDDQTLIQWLIQEKLDSGLLIQLVRRQQRYVEEMLRKTIKNIFLNGEKLEQYLEQNELINNCLSLLMSISDDVSVGKAPTRDKLMGVDNLQGVILEKISTFESKIVHFNRQIAKIIDQLYEFQNSISQQFRLFFNKNTQNKLSPNKSRLDVFDKPDEIYEENIILDPVNRTTDYDYSRTQGGNSKFRSEYRQEPLYRTGFPIRGNYASKLSQKNEVSQLGINSQLLIGSNANRDKERNLRSELLVQTKSYFR